ncbi:single-pass membrane and coiled-coil domain-containing protein 4 isoform X1 [Motacilla alba alba]|uniref:single-pass membrane and coiled-coil domain-containing protein 4 isoform X1 n=1 Tax=Motacilla alba alba TaxID=1094192 RepID=UPI0018D5A0B5|nr:single-pass membrane and coiled-coil domain-containing protein 4 isoform X1 [Motacilla alba alba]XP_037998427.1 single-pass membrane and coiled-coil domain-containing protein 4 isoform X1 [Motacilla alba alba]
MQSGWVLICSVSCTANHSTENKFFSLLFQKTSDNLLLFHSLWSHISAKKKDPKRRMRQLRGKPKKETSKDKKERKQAMQEARQQITTVVLPTLAVVVLLIVVFVYVATRPNTTE